MSAARLLRDERRTLVTRGRALLDKGTLTPDEQADVDRTLARLNSITDSLMALDEGRGDRETTGRGGFNILPSMRQYHEQVESRVMSGIGGASGGFVIPAEQAVTFFDRLRPESVVLSANPVILTMEHSDLTVPMLGGSVSVGLFSENAEITASDLSLAQRKFSARKLAALVRASNEALADSAPALREILSFDLLRQMGTFLDAQMLEGNGVGVNLLGIRRAAGTVTELGAGNGLAPMLDDVLAAIGRLEQSNAKATAIFLHPRTWATFKTSKDGAGRYNLQPDPSADAPRSVFGVPVFLSSQMSITETVGSSADCSWIGVADMRQFAVARRSDVSLVYDASRYLEYDQTAVRVTSRWDSGFLNAAGIDVITGVRP